MPLPRSCRDWFASEHCLLAHRWAWCWGPRCVGLGFGKKKGELHRQLPSVKNLRPEYPGPHQRGPESHAHQAPVEYRRSGMFLEAVQEDYRFAKLSLLFGLPEKDGVTDSFQIERSIELRSEDRDATDRPPIRCLPISPLMDQTRLSFCKRHCFHSCFLQVNAPLDCNAGVEPCSVSAADRVLDRQRRPQPEGRWLSKSRPVHFLDPTGPGSSRHSAGERIAPTPAANPQI